MSALLSANPIPTSEKIPFQQKDQQHLQERRQSFAPPEVQNILVAVDFSKYSETALRYATFLAENFHATVTLVHSVEPYIYPEDLSAGLTIEQLDERGMQKQKEKLEVVRQTIPEGIPVTVAVTLGTPWKRIVDAAKSWNADLIVIGTHGRTGLRHALMGSTAERVVRHSGCPVMVVPSPTEAISDASKSIMQNVRCCQQETVSACR